MKAAFDKFGGSLPLPVIKNGKTADPRDKKSTKVLEPPRSSLPRPTQ